MRPVAFKIAISGGRSAEITGFPTGTPGLVVHEAYQSCGLSGDDWMVTHARSGLTWARCWASPEGALAFATDLGAFADWRSDAVTLRGEFSSTRQRRIVWRCAAARGGRIHSAIGAVGTPLDNGVIA
jgi:hypothetical protein